MANCVDNTFRIRVKCKPCFSGPVCCCPDVTLPEKFCLTLGTASFNYLKSIVTGDEPTGACNAVLWESAFSNKTIQLTRQSGAEFDGPCDISNVQAGNGGVWTGTATFTIAACPYGLSTMTYNVRLGCGPGLSNPSPSSNKWGLRFTFAGYNFACGSPYIYCMPGLMGFCAAHGMPANPIPHVCADPLGLGDLVFDCETGTATGTLVGDYPGDGAASADTNTIPFTLAPSTGSGCETVDGTCCASEVASHPALCVFWRVTGSSLISSFTATWTNTFCGSLTGWVWQSTDSGNIHDLWFIQCPENNVTNAWVAYHWTFDQTIALGQPGGYPGSLTSPPPDTIARGTGDCSPLSADLTYGGGSLSITLGDCGPGVGESCCGHSMEQEDAPTPMSLVVPVGAADAGTYSFAWDANGLGTGNGCWIATTSSGRVFQLYNAMAHPWTTCLTWASLALRKVPDPDGGTPMSPLSASCSPFHAWFQNPTQWGSGTYEVTGV